MTAIIQISDHDLLIKIGSETVHSQGYAWLKGKQVYFDLDADNIAIKHSRLTPQQINNHYWQQCDQTSIVNNGCGMRSAADLIWRHLGDLKKQQNLQDVIFVVPSHYQAENLQLLLGIAKSCQLNVLGLINRAVLATQDQAGKDGEYLHFDIQLHQTVCTSLSVENGLLTLTNTEIVHDVGLLMLEDALLKTIQHNFIQNDRFDPLHNAQTEQQLFDQLPQLASKIFQSAKSNISLGYKSRQHTANIDVKQWNRTVQPYLEILNKASMQRKYQGVFYSFNGFQAIQINQSQGTVLSDALEVTAQQLSAWTQSDNSDGIAYITELPISNKQLIIDTPAVSEAPSKSESDKRPATNNLTDLSASSATLQPHQVTHLLQSGIAVRLQRAMIKTDNGVLTLQTRTVESSASVQQLLDQGVIFIAHDDDRKSLQTNDRLTSNLADGVITAIQVQPSEDNQE